MVLAVHIIVGAAIAAKTNSLVWGLILAFLSHYLLDSMPHSSYSVENLKQRKWGKTAPDFFKIFLDILFGFLFVLLFVKSPSLALLGGLVAIVPDGVNFLTIVFPKSSLIYSTTHIFNNFHLKINNFSENIGSPFLRIAIQAVIVLIVLAVFCS